MGKSHNEIAYELEIRGLVQGVGFRPFLLRLALLYQIKGWVKNTNKAVVVHIQGNENLLNQYIKAIYEQKPAPANIASIQKTKVACLTLHDFDISTSENTGTEVTQVSPDIAVCEACMDDTLLHPNRLNYPLVNCCHCGPRFSIVRALPYDRDNTTMSPFTMCNACRLEYENPADRRFHAQPVACNTCGPEYVLFHTVNGVQQSVTGTDNIAKTVATGIDAGNVFAVKGLGGFHLLCDATSHTAVTTLRSIKNRDTKPFAIMFRNMACLQEHCLVSSAEEHALLSFRRPVVLLKQKQPLADSVNFGLTSIGAFLPYMPFHYFIFNYLKTNAIVLTSGNISDEPIIIDNQMAIDSFLHCTSGVLVYNRAIHNRLDDSVVFAFGNKTSLVRRSRGFVPNPVKLDATVESIFAAGAELTGTWSMGKNNECIVSQYIGDLKNEANFNFYTESFARFSELFRFKPKMAICDLHPDYVSTQFAQTLNIPVKTVQHHYAHILSVMAEHAVNEPIIGIAFDGTGLGTDGNIWGGEFLYCNTTDFERFAHFQYIPLPGGDKVVDEPWRTAVSLLYSTFGRNFLTLDIPFVKKLDTRKTNMLLQAIDKNINTPLSSSCGRLFDAVACLTEICPQPAYHAECPMRVESLVCQDITDSYTVAYAQGIVSFNDMFIEMVADIQLGELQQTIATKFHNTLINTSLLICIKMFDKYKTNKVALSGGTFQNKYLLENIENKLAQNGFEVFINQQVPANDAGISLGQMYWAGKQNSNSNIKLNN